MIILGIDPGFAIVGWGVLESNKGRVRPIAYGAITTPAHTPLEYRLAMIEDDMNALFEKYHPDEMGIEELFFDKNITTGIRVAEARGIILCSAYRHGVKIGEYSPVQVKSAVVGYGKADKHQVIAMVTSLLKLPEPPKPDDTADALAVAICHAQSSHSAMGQYFNLR